MSDETPLPTGKHTLVEEGTELSGKISSKVPIVVMGKVEGEVAGPSVHVTASGVVAGTVKVKELRCDGEIAGDIEADSVKLSGRVRDKTVIRARMMEMALTAGGKGGMQVQFGECELAVGDAPNKEAAIAGATATAPAAEPAAAEAGESKKDDRKRRGQDIFEENGAATVAEDNGKRKRGSGTQPPPV
jgi:cytoskeletal protein CcmA (bactofilin family)